VVVGRADRVQTLGREDASGVVPKAVDGTLHETTSSLSGNAEIVANLTEAALFAIDQPEASSDCIAGPFIERTEQLAKQTVSVGLHEGILGRDLIGSNQVNQGGVAVIADRTVKGDRAGDTLQIGVFVIKIGTNRRGLAERGAQAGRTIAGQANEAGLLIKSPADGLANPEGGIGGELEASTPVELVDSVLETEVAFLNEVAQIHPLGEGVAAGDGDDQPEVGADEAIFGRSGGTDFGVEGRVDRTIGELPGGLVALFDGAGKIALFNSVEKRNFADIVEIETE
jgi:hypothetical protein